MHVEKLIFVLRRGGDLHNRIFQLDSLYSGAVPAPTSSAEFGKILSDELARWGRVVREKNIKED